MCTPAKNDKALLEASLSWWNLLGDEVHAHVPFRVSYQGAGVEDTRRQRPGVGLSTKTFSQYTGQPYYPVTQPYIVLCIVLYQCGKTIKMKSRHEELLKFVRTHFLQKKWYARSNDKNADLIHIHV